MHRAAVVVAVGHQHHRAAGRTRGSGTQVLVNGKPVGEPIKEPEFMQSLLRIWLGKNPADDALKEALLGREVRPVTNPGQQ